MNNRNLLIVLLLTLTGLMPLNNALAVTYTVSPSGYTSVPTTDVTQGSRVFHGNLLQAKATVSGSTLTFTLKKKDNSLFQNNGTIVVKYDSCSGKSALTNGSYYGGIYNPSASMELDFTSGSKTYVVTIRSGDIFYYTNPITVTANSQATVNLTMASAGGFGTTTLNKGTAYTYSVKVKNNGSAEWYGSFYLKCGDEKWLEWNKLTIGAGSTYTLSKSYTPTSTGSKQLTLYYQTGATGSGVEVNAGSYSNPITVTVAEGTTQQANLTITDGTYFGTSILTKGLEHTFKTTIKNNGSTRWSGGIFLKSGSEDCDKVGLALAAGESAAIEMEYTPTTTGSKSFTLYYQTSNSGSGLPVNGGSYSNPFSVTIQPSTPDLTLASANGFGATSLSQGKEYTYTVKVKNNASTPYYGSFYLKCGDDVWLDWYKVTIGAGSTYTLTKSYTPTSTGSKQLTLYSQAGGKGSGVKVSAGSYSNPFTVTVQPPAVSLTMASAGGFGTTTLNKGTAYTYTAKVKNNSTAEWYGSFYLKCGDDLWLEWNKLTIGAGSTYTLSKSYTPTSTGSKQLTLYYQTGATGGGVEVEAGSYSNPVTVTVKEAASNRLATPGSLSATNIKPTTFTAKWGAVSGATTYDCYVYKAGESSIYFYRSVPTTYTEVENLQPNTSYTFKVRARNGNSTQNSDWSPLSASVKTQSSTQSVNLTVYRYDGIQNSEAVTVGQARKYSARLWNKSDSRWQGSAQLREGSTVIYTWKDISLPTNTTQPLEYNYTPTSAGTKTLSLYYLNGGTGTPTAVSGGSIQVQAGTDQTVNDNLRLEAAISCPATLELGKQGTVTAKVRNTGTGWNGTLYLMDNGIAIDSKSNLSAGETKTLSKSEWTPQGAGTHTISVEYKSSNGTSRQYVPAGDYANPVSVYVTNNNALTTASKAVLKHISKGLAPQEVTVGSEVYYYYRITNEKGTPLKGMKIRFNGTAALKSFVMDSEPSDENGCVTLRFQTSGSEAIISRGETAYLLCNKVLNANGEEVPFTADNADKEIKLTVNKGNTFSNVTGFENVESMSITVEAGFGADGELGSLRENPFDLDGSITHPLTLEFGWNKSTGKLAKIGVESGLQGGLKTSLDISNYFNLELGVNYSWMNKTTYNTSEPWKTTLATAISVVESVFFTTNSTVMTCITALEAWYKNKYGKQGTGFFEGVIEPNETYTNAKWMLNTKGNVDLLKGIPEIAGKIMKKNGAVSLPLLDRLSVFKVNGDALFTFQPNKVLYTDYKWLYGTNRSLKLGLSGNFGIALGQISGPSSPFWQKAIGWSTSGYNTVSKFLEDTKSSSTLSFAAQITEEEIYTSEAKTKLAEISNTFELTTAVDMSTKNLEKYLPAKWVADRVGFKAGLTLSNSMKQKMTSKGAWLNRIETLSENNDTYRDKAGDIFPAFDSWNIIANPISHYNVWKGTSSLSALNYFTDNEDYNLAEPLKVTQQCSSKLKANVTIPYTHFDMGWYGDFDITLNFGIGLNATYFASESYYSVQDKCFLPIVTRPTTTLDNISKALTSYLQDKLDGLFTDQDKEEITEEYKIAQKFEDYEAPDFATALSNKGSQHQINSAARRIRNKHPMIVEKRQEDICTLTFMLNEETQNFEKGTKVAFSHFYPAGCLLGITQQNDTLFVISEVCNLSAMKDSELLTKTNQGTIKLETQIGADDLTPFGFRDDQPLDVYYSEPGTEDVWQYVGPAGTPLNIDRMGKYMMATSIKNDIKTPEIEATLHGDARLMHIHVSDNIGIRTSSISVFINGEARDITMLSESDFEVQLTQHDMDYMITLFVTANDLAGNQGQLFQVFNMDKPDSIEDVETEKAKAAIHLSSTQLKVEGAEPDVTVMLFSIKGDVIGKTLTDGNGNAQLRINRLPAGIYIVALSNGQARKFAVR